MTERRIATVAWACEPARQDRGDRRRFGPSPDPTAPGSDPRRARLREA